LYCIVHRVVIQCAHGREIGSALRGGSKGWPGGGHRPPVRIMWRYGGC